MNADEDLNRLDDLLMSLPMENEGMLLSEFDGFVSGLVVCPDMVMPGEWLPMVWGDDVVPNFETVDEVQNASDLIMGHYNNVARSLTPPMIKYGPVLDHDTRTGEILWEVWVTGFERAMRLRMNAWERIVESGDEEAASSVNMMLALYDIAEGKSDLPKSSIDELTERAPDLIADMVLALNAWTKGNSGGSGIPFPFPANSPQAPFRGQKTGRNDPCPCGSGRKYKRCCGAN